jgi:tetratricopeptide (TPR) repeat protein
MNLPYLVSLLIILWLPHGDRLLTEADHSAELPQACDLGEIKRSLANYQASDATELRDRAENRSKYAGYVANLATCTGQEARILRRYFQGLVARMRAEDMEDRDPQRSSDQLTRALKHLNKAIDRDSSKSYLLNERAIIFELLGQLAEAQADYERAIALDTSWALPQSNLGNVLLERGSNNAAKRFYRQAQRKKKNLEVAHLGLSIALATEAPAQSQKELAAVNATYLNSRKDVARARILFAQGNSGQAIAIYDSILQANPGRNRVRLALADQLARGGQIPKALDTLRSVLGRQVPPKLRYRSYQLLYDIYQRQSTHRGDIRNIFLEEWNRNRPVGSLYAYTDLVNESTKVKDVLAALPNAAKSQSARRKALIYREAAQVYFGHNRLEQARAVAREGRNRLGQSVIAHHTFIEISLICEIQMNTNKYGRVARAMRRAWNELGLNLEKRKKLKRRICRDANFYEDVIRKNVPAELKECI